MTTIRVTQIRGKKLIAGKIKKLKLAIPHNIRQGLEDSAMYLRDKAIENLIDKSVNPHLSIDGESIADKNNWTIRREEDLKVALECISKHAAVVEFGDTVLRQGRTKIYASSKKYKGWPIGRQQGAGDHWSAYFTIQSPKYYFTTAVRSKDVQNSIKNLIEYNLEKAIRRI